VKCGLKANFIILTVIFYLLLLIPTSQAQWWNDSWQYRVNSVYVSPGIPYQMQLKVHNTSGTNNATDIFLDGNAAPYFKDLRFILNDTDELGHWIEDVTTDPAIVWVNVTSTGTVTAYYGNENAANSSDFDNTFTKDVNTDGLVIHFHLDEGGTSTTLKDLSGCNNDGSLYNFAIPGNSTSGWQGLDGGHWGNKTNVTFSTGDYLRFDGVDDHVKVSVSDTINVTDAMTIGFWMRTDQGIGEGYMICRENWPVWKVSIKQGIIRWTVTTENGTTNCDSFNTYNDSKWHYVVGTFDQALNGEEMKLYIDGQLVNKADRNGTSILSYYAPLWFGRRNSGWYYAGDLDEVRMWNRSLSADEVERYYYRSRYYSPAPIWTTWSSQFEGQNTFIELSNGTFGEVLAGSNFDDNIINITLKLNNTGGNAANVEARFTTSYLGTYGLVNSTNVIGGSNFRVGNTTFNSLMDNDADVQLTDDVVAGTSKIYTAQLRIPPQQNEGDYVGQIELTFSNE
jgi:hypothetical protein